MKIQLTSLIAGMTMMACGSSPDTTIKTGPETKVYSVIDLHYTPELRAVCAGIKAPTFSYDSAALTAKDKRQLSKLADCVAEPKLAQETIHVVGHTDPRGTAEYNRDLGKERALAVKQSLVANGIAANRVVVESHGESEASVRPWDWAMERRVDIGISNGGQWTFTQQRVVETVPGKTVEGEFREKEDTDGDGVDEPGVYPKESDDSGDADAMDETGDPDGDGVDEPASS